MTVAGWLSCARILVVAVVVAVAFGVAVSDAAQPERCADFRTRAEARLYGPSRLDRDGDGIPCERLP